MKKGDCVRLIQHPGTTLVPLGTIGWVEQGRSDRSFWVRFPMYYSPHQSEGMWACFYHELEKVEVEHVPEG